MSGLEEVSTKDRIKLVQGDSVRKYGQIIIAFILIGSMLSYLGWYTITQSDAVTNTLGFAITVIFTVSVSGHRSNGGESLTITMY